MKSLVSEAVAMQDKLLEFRYKVGSQLAQQAEDERAVTRYIFMCVCCFRFAISTLYCCFVVGLAVFLLN